MYKVLLVDDEILVRDAIRENINWNELGYELVGVCENGKVAAEYVELHPVDLVLTDICMPHMDGMGLSKFLSENYPNVAIVIFSGFSDFDYAKQAIKYKVMEYLLKPITATELTSLLINVKNQLDETYEGIKEQNLLKQTYKSYRKNHSIILSNTLNKLVMGTQSINQSLKELQELGLTLEAFEYRVGIVEIDMYAQLYGMNESVKKEASLMGFVVENISNEILSNHHAGIAFLDDTRINLLLYTNKTREFNKIVEVICREIQENVLSISKLSITISIGTYVQKVEDLHLSYDSAVKGISYRFLLGEGIIMDMEQISQRIEGNASIDSCITEMVIALKNNDYMGIESSLSGIRRKLIENLVGQNRAYLYVQQVIRSISDEIIELKGASFISVSHKEKLLDQVANCSMLDDALAIVRNYAFEVSAAISNLKHSSGQRQARLAVDYIKKNYGESSLSLNSICSYLCISTSHFSSIFKESTGKTFMEMLISVRMEKAKELLEQTSMKNYEIAERVGFSDPHYFSISFKKMIGMSPTEYAKERKKNE